MDPRPSPSPRARDELATAARAADLDGPPARRSGRGARGTLLDAAPWLAGVALVLAASAGGADPHAAQEHLPATDGEQDSAEWAPGAQCRDCHPLEVDGYRESGMAQALGPLREDELVGLAPVTETSTGYEYRLESAGSAGFLRETWRAEARLQGPQPSRIPRPPTPPAPSSERALPLAFAIGAGVLDRSFAALADGRLWFAPLEVLTAKDGKKHAALAPPHAMQPGLRLDQPITPECLGCHTDAPPPRDWPLNLQPAAERWQPRGISCAACHAHSDEHARWRAADLAGEAPPGGDPLLAPGELTRLERLSVCAACHLQGDARIELVPQSSGGIGPPAPGGDLLATRAVFVAAQPTDEIGFVSQLERLTLSRCFLESSGAGDEGGGARGMLCETCHDPHHALSAPGARERVRAGCFACHPSNPGDAGDAAHAASACSLDAQARAGRDCASCHMRLTAPFDVADVEIHDHFIQREPGPPSRFERLRFPESPEGNWRLFQWPGAEPPAHAAEPGLQMMALAHRGHVERALALVDRPAGELLQRLPMYHHVRGSLLERAERRADAVLAYRRALALDPELAESSTNLGLLLGRLGRVREGLAVLDDLLARHPRADGALANRALLHRSVGSLAAFERDAEQSFRLRPRPELAEALARHHADAGRAAEARRWSDEARRLDPARGP